MTPTDAEVDPSIPAGDVSELMLVRRADVVRVIHALGGIPAGGSSARGRLSRADRPSLADAVEDLGDYLTSCRQCVERLAEDQRRLLFLEADVVSAVHQPTTRPAEPGELCSCGHQAVVVYQTERFGAVGYCGVPGRRSLVDPDLLVEADQ